MRTVYFLFKSLATLCLTLLFIGTFLLLALYTYTNTQLPHTETLKNIELQVPMRIYTKDGLLIGTFGEIRRTPIALEKIPKQLIEAVLATEDQRFYEHYGVDIFGLTRATLQLLYEGKKSQGGSTITMQVARNFFLTSQKTFLRKLNEILLAIKIDNELPKDKILELYLNRIYFGNRAYGIAAAAEVYYGKPLSALSLPELAMLAGLPKAPSILSPLTNPEGAKKRRDHVLARMLERQYIDPATYNLAINAPIKPHITTSQVAVPAPYVAEMVRDILVNHFGDDAYKKGLKVYTTIDSKQQLAANASISKNLLAYAKRHGHHGPIPEIEGALIALDPTDGAITALVGGFNFINSNFNRVTQAHRQPGSAFKPFVYAAGLAKGFTLASLINDAPLAMQIPGVDKIWRPQNDNRTFWGPTPLRMGLVKSRNLVSIRLLDAIGIPYAIDYITQFGFEKDKLPPGLSLALGTASVTPLQVARGYAVFANGGSLVSPHVIEKVENLKGEIIFKAPPPIATPVIEPEIAYLITSALKEVITHGTGHDAAVLNRADIAGKTGTTNDRVDGWFAGFNSNIVAVTWIGFDQQRSINEWAARSALPIWIDFMREALKGKPEKTLPEPAGIITMRINPETGFPATSNGNDSYFEIFWEKYLPNSSAQIPDDVDETSPDSGADTDVPSAGAANQEPLF